MKNKAKRYRQVIKKTPTKNQIKSYGVVVINSSNKHVFKHVLLVQRKDSFGYITCIDNKTFCERDVDVTLKTITVEEKEKLLRWSWDKLWKDCGLDKKKSSIIKEQCKARFEWLDIRSLISAMDQRGHDWQAENMWGIPKGRMAPIDNETGLRCALREFEEETGVKKTDIIIDHSLGTKKEEYIGTDGKEYTSIYYIATTVKDLPLLSTKKVDKTEVRQIQWVNFEEKGNELPMRESTRCLIKEVLND